MSAGIKAFIGIDFGCKNARVAVFTNGGVNVLVDEFGGRSMPSCVAFNEMRRFVGGEAAARFAVNPRSTISTIKSILGANYHPGMEYQFPFQIVGVHDGKVMVEVQYCGKFRRFFMEEIAAIVIRRLKEMAESFLKTSVDDCVLTVPASYGTIQQLALIDAATINRLNVLGVYVDSSAAAVAFGFDKISESKERQVLVFDAGASNVSVTVLSLKEGAFEVKGVAGMRNISGDAFDKRLLEHLVQELRLKHGKDVSQNQRSTLRLSAACEKAKRVLSSSSRAQIEVDSLIGDFDFNTIITRSQFEEVSLDLFRQCMHPVEQALTQARIAPPNISEVIITGGSSRIPKLQELLSGVFNGRVLCKSVNADEAVVTGAAILAATLQPLSLLLPEHQRAIADRRIQQIRFIDCTSRAFGVQIGGNILSVVPKGCALPAKMSVTATISSSSVQRGGAVLEILEGDDNTVLTEWQLQRVGAATSRSGGTTTVDITIEVYAQHNITVSVHDRSTGAQEGLHLTGEVLHRMSDKEIASARETSYGIQEHEAYLDQCDAARNSLESTLINTLQSLDDPQALCGALPAAAKARIKILADKISTWLETNQYAALDDIRGQKALLERMINTAIDGTLTPGGSSTGGNGIPATHSESSSLPLTGKRYRDNDCS